jgi:uncharacterized protein YjiS (DUF1127 family)
MTIGRGPGHIQASSKETAMMSNSHALSSASSTSARHDKHGAGSVLKSWWDAYWTMRARRTTVMMLRSLDDRSLHDIGVDRSEIESVVYGKPRDRTLHYERNWR